MCKIRNRAARLLAEYEVTNTVGVQKGRYSFRTAKQDNNSGWWIVYETTPDGVGYTTAPNKRHAQWIIALGVVTHFDKVECDCKEWCR